MRRENAFHRGKCKRERESAYVRRWAAQRTPGDNATRVEVANVHVGAWANPGPSPFFPSSLQNRILIPALVLIFLQGLKNGPSVFGEA
jgi:hypothetical protein